VVLARDPNRDALLGKMNDRVTNLSANDTMSKRLEGRVALITGAAAGIGRATAELFAQHGAKVIATDCEVERLVGLHADKRWLDVTDAAAVTSLANEMGRLDILFNCAGFVENGTILDNDEAQWEKSFQINVYAMARMIKAFLPGMIENGGGSIINVASVASSITGVQNRCIYGASKAAVIGMTKAVATDFVTKGIRCNTVCPGTVDSPSLRQRLRDTGDYEAARKAFTARQPMGRLGTAEEIGSIVLWLASDDSAFATGQNFVVDGGITI
jgi:2-keto-3-deoxy-L-fuconate dehydrogenase